MNTPHVTHLGAQLLGQTAALTVWAPKAETVACEISGSGKHVPLEKNQYGYWSARTDLLRAGSHYRFVIDGQAYPDPTSRSQPEGVHGPSELLDLHFPWEDQSYQPPAWKDYIIYELHVGTFTPTQDFDGVADKLPYLRELGITAIEIMPVNQFPGTRNWGYDGVFPFAVQHSYGGAAGLQRLVNAAHKQGIAVILDVVYNHFGPEGNYAPNYGPYFTDKYGTPWGSAVNFDDAYANGVRDFVLANVRMWFEDFHIDALRIDAAHALKDLSATHILQDIRRETDQWIQTNETPHYLIVECDLNDRKYLEAPDKNGYGMDAQWVDEFHHALRVAAGEERKGYYADFNGVADLAKAFQDAYVYTGQFSDHRKKFFGSQADGLPGQQFVVFAQNHDQVGNRMLGERSSVLFSPAMQRLMALAVIASPYIPMLFMGEEWATTKPFQYFVNHSDEQLIEAVRKGRKEEFASFHGQGDAPDPQSPETFKNCMLDWSETEQPPHQTMLTYYRSLLALRKSNFALRRGDRSLLTVQYDESRSIISLSYACGKDLLLCALNFSDNAQTIELDSHHRWEKIWDTSDPKWGGDGPVSDQIRGQVQLPAQTGVIFQQL